MRHTFVLSENNFITLLYIYEASRVKRCFEGDRVWSHFNWWMIIIFIGVSSEYCCIQWFFARVKIGIILQLNISHFYILMYETLSQLPYPWCIHWVFIFHSNQGIINYLSNCWWQRCFCYPCRFDPQQTSHSEFFHWECLVVLQKNIFGCAASIPSHSNNCVGRVPVWPYCRVWSWEDGKLREELPLSR